MVAVVLLLSLQEYPSSFLSDSLILSVRLCLICLKFLEDCAGDQGKDGMNLEIYYCFFSSSPPIAQVY